MKKFLVAICAAGLLITGCGNNKTVEQPAPKVETPAPAPAPIQPAAPDKVLNLGMTFEQFKAAYNANIYEYASETGWDVSAVVLQSGQYKDTFNYRFLPTLGMIGTVEKNTGLIKEVGIMALPQNEDETIATTLVYGLLIATLNPELNYEQRGELFDELNFSGNGMFRNLPVTEEVAIRGNVLYKTGLSSDGIFLFVASAKDS